jgi:hypothetical protein
MTSPSSSHSDSYIDNKIKRYRNSMCWCLTWCVGAMVLFTVNLLTFVTTNEMVDLVRSFILGSIWAAFTWHHWGEYLKAKTRYEVWKEAKVTWNEAFAENEQPC